MAQFQPPVTQQQDAIKKYGQLAGGFKNGMRTAEFLGTGQQLVQNAQIKTGIYKKMEGNQNFVTITGAVSILSVEEYKKSDGAFQTLVTYFDGTDYKFRAIEADGTILTPTGGAGDPDFSSAVFGFVQIGITGYLSNRDTAVSSKNLFSWNGTALVAVTNCPDYPDFLSRDGQRIVTSAEGIMYFSQRSISIFTSFTGGAAFDVDGNYNVNTAGTPQGAISGAAGLMIFWETGAELHNIKPNDAGTDVWPETRENTFEYTGGGVENNKQLVAGKFFRYAVNSDGLWKIDPVRGNADNLIDDEQGKIKRYWSAFEFGEMTATYSKKEEMVVVTLSTNDTVVNDLLVCYHEPSSAMFLKKNSNFKSLGVVNNQLYGGASIGGDVKKIFTKNLYQNGDQSATQFQVVQEWDIVGDANTFKLPLNLRIFASLSPNSSFTVNAYTNGFTDEPVMSQTFTTVDVTDTSSVIGGIGSYKMALGTPDTVNNTDTLTKNFFSNPFLTWCFEIVEESEENFELYGVELEYTTLNRTNGENSLANKLFDIV